MFKNIMIYQMNRTLEITEEILRNSLPALAFTPCGSQDIQKTGFVSHMKGYDELFFAANGQILINVYKEEKILPTHVINEFLAEKVEKIEDAEGRKLKKAEKDKLKDEVIMDLLPKAFTKGSKTPVWIDPINKLIIVESGSAKKAEDALALLRKALGSLPVTPLTPQDSPNIIMTEWVKNGAAVSGLLIGDEIEMKSTTDEGVVTSKKQNIQEEEILNHIEKGKLVSKLSFIFDDKISFLLTDDLSIKKIKMTDVIKDKISDEMGEDPENADKFSAEFTIYTGEITQLIKCIMGAFNCQQD